MWECQKCGEEIEDSFDACWNCGTSQEGGEDPAFQMEADAAEQVASPGTNRRLNGFWAGAFVTAVVGYINFLAPHLVAYPTTPWIRNNLGRLLAGAALWSLIVAGGGGIAGWIGGRTKHLGVAAYRGALVVLATQGLMIILLDSPFRFFEMPFLRMAAVLVNVSALGAIAGCVGAVIGRPRDVTATTESVQYSLSEMLFLTVLCSLLFASLAVLSR